MIQNERETRPVQLEDAVRQMMTAARTAPKGKGLDIIEIAAVTGDDIPVLSEKIKELGEQNGLKFFFRDAGNILSAGAVVLIGTYQKTHGLNCAHCGFPTCGEKPETTPCVLNTVDVGIAIGSACATAVDLRLDTRVMFSAGLAAQKLNWLNGCQTVFAIPVSISSKNPFFDRKPKEPEQAASLSPTET
ncbi:MAG: DUF2148 domain-containing protein [Tannerella sp.]|jgi:uncharacterized ferredoxin-like protein|nr:DUF2148 domain-containing protein [Tannerella sp.]